MVHINQLTASGSRELKRPRRIPANVRQAVGLMVFGKLDDPDCAPIGFIEAAKLVGIKPDVMRRYLDRADVRALLLSERRAFRTAICASNENALRKVRDTAANSMAIVASVRALEELDDDRAAGYRSGQIPQTPGFVIQIVNHAPVQPPPAEAPPSSAPGFTIIDAPAIERSQA